MEEDDYDDATELAGEGRIEKRDEREGDKREKGTREREGDERGEAKWGGSMREVACRAMD